MNKKLLLMVSLACCMNASFVRAESGYEELGLTQETQETTQDPLQVAFQDAITEWVMTPGQLFMPFLLPEYQEAVVSAVMRTLTLSDDELMLIAEKQAFAVKCVQNPRGAEALAFEVWQMLYR